MYKGELHKDQESLLMVKCSKERLGEIAALIRQGHPYENPEFICVDVDAGLPAYLNWVLRPGGIEGDGN